MYVQWLPSGLPHHVALLYLLPALSRHSSYLPPCSTYCSWARQESAAASSAAAEAGAAWQEAQLLSLLRAALPAGGCRWTGACCGVLTQRHTFQKEDCL